MARSLVDAGNAQINSPGRVKAVSLTESAATSAQRIGEPTGRAAGVRFTRWEHLDESGTRVVQHHPRSTDYE